MCSSLLENKTETGAEMLLVKRRLPVSRMPSICRCVYEAYMIRLFCIICTLLISFGWLRLHYLLAADIPIRCYSHLFTKCVSNQYGANRMCSEKILQLKERKEKINESRFLDVFVVRSPFHKPYSLLCRHPAAQIHAKRDHVRAASACALIFSHLGPHEKHSHSHLRKIIYCLCLFYEFDGKAA